MGMLAPISVFIRGVVVVGGRGGGGNADFILLLAMA